MSKKALFVLLAACLTVQAADSSVMHCFAFTPIKEATQADWDAFYKGTDALPNTMHGIVKKVWYGKLANPLAQFRLDADAVKKLRAGEADVPAAKTNISMREYGVCMEFANEAAMKKYKETPPAQKTWTALYDKVRVPGTTTYDILPAGK